MEFPQKILLLACSRRAWHLQASLCGKIVSLYPATECICKVKCAELEEISVKQKLAECVGDYFSKVDAIVFLCAAGIAVRSIAPYLVHKSKDPAVVVIDETGTFCVSLLSGHWGGANALAKTLADMMEAIPVVTTATERAHKFAVDVFAAENELLLSDWKLAKKISARILSGETIAVCSELPWQEGQRFPKELTDMGICADGLHEDMADAMAGQLCIYIGGRCLQAQKQTEILQLIPRNITIGIGCRRGIGEAEIAGAVYACLQENGMDIRAVKEIASIDLKKDEAGILAFAKKHAFSFVTFSAESLSQAEGSVSDSPFVERVTGVPNVCERAALAASGGTLICKKKIYGKVTVALAEKKRSLTIS